MVSGAKYWESPGRPWRVSRLLGLLLKPTPFPSTEPVLSDVLALSKPGMLLLTGLVNAQVIRTAIVSDLCGVVFVRGKKPGKDILDLAVDADIPVMATDLTMFEAAGVLYRAISGR